MIKPTHYTWYLVSPTQLVLASYPTISHLKPQNNVHLRFNCVHGVLSSQPNWFWLHTQQSPTWSHGIMFTCASTVYMHFCNLSTELNVPPLVATNLLNHLKDFVKTPLSFNTSVTDPFSIPNGSHLQELSDLGTTWQQTLSIFNKKFSEEVSIAGILVFLTHCRLGTSAEAQSVIPLPQVPLSGLPEPFHARSSWILTCGSGFLSCKDNPLLCTRFCESDFVYLLNWDGTALALRPTTVAGHRRRTTLCAVSYQHTCRTHTQP